MLIIDKIAYNNRLAETNPYLKCGIGIFFLLLSIIWNHIGILIAIFLGMNILLIKAAKVNPKIYIRLLTIPSVFILLSLLGTLFYVDKSSDGFLYSITFFGYSIGYSRFTLVRAIYSLLRCFSALTCIYFITLTTSFNQLILVFKTLHVPKEIIEIVMLVYRFIFIFFEETAQIYITQELRFGYLNLKTSYHSMGILLSTLFTRVMTRYRDMSIALETKFYDGEFYI